MTELKKTRGRPNREVGGWWTTKRVYFHRLYNVTNEQWESINEFCNKINDENYQKYLLQSGEK